jgi:hypothetical protein
MYKKSLFALYIFQVIVFSSISWAVNNEKSDNINQTSVLKKREHIGD